MIEVKGTKGEFVKFNVSGEIDNKKKDGEPLCFEMVENPDNPDNPKQIYRDKVKVALTLLTVNILEALLAV